MSRIRSTALLTSVADLNDFFSGRPLEMSPIQDFNPGLKSIPNPILKLKKVRDIRIFEILRAKIYN